MAGWGPGGIPGLVQPGHPAQGHALHGHSHQHPLQHLRHVPEAGLPAGSAHHLLCASLLHAVCEGHGGGACDCV